MFFWEVDVGVANPRRKKQLETAEGPSDSKFGGLVKSQIGERREGRSLYVNSSQMGLKWTKFRTKFHYLVTIKARFRK